MQEKELSPGKDGEWWTFSECLLDPEIQVSEASAVHVVEMSASLARILQRGDVRELSNNVLFQHKFPKKCMVSPKNVFLETRPIGTVQLSTCLLDLRAAVSLEDMLLGSTTSLHST